ncbi:MAG: hypothetical protein Ct9H90mP9_2110 [Pseudomonadota bacterium]|nr:MAG: hypothetical protein Ct9H90mP9_2110 [Pseudomonadota bacterium]
MAFDQEPDRVLDQLEFPANDLLKTINDMKAGPREAQHYEQYPQGTIGYHSFLKK